MSTKDIRPTDSYTACDVCGRTLLRGEHADVFINGGVRRSVCELCKGRALHEGWIREGTVPEYDPREADTDRRRPLLRRLRHRERPDRDASAPSLDDALGAGWPDAGGWHEEPGDDELIGDPEPRAEQRRERRARRAREPRRARESRNARERNPEPAREPRHVRAIPASEENKVATALQLFNGSEHPRTVAGVTRSLGGPIVAVTPDGAHPTLVRLVVSWELCWYRYEVDLSEGSSGVRLDAQGYDLDELDELERVPAAAADENGRLVIP